MDVPLDIKLVIGAMTKMHNINDLQWQWYNDNEIQWQWSTPTFSIVYGVASSMKMIKWQKPNYWPQTLDNNRNLGRTSKIKIRSYVHEHLIETKVREDIRHMRQILAQAMTNCLLTTKVSLISCSLWKLLNTFPDNSIKIPLNGIQENNLTNIS